MGLRLRLLRLDLLPRRIPDDAWLIVGRIFTGRLAQPADSGADARCSSRSVWLYQFVYESRLRPLLRLGSVRVGLAVCMMLYLCLCSSGGGTFIYFQF